MLIVVKATDRKGAAVSTAPLSEKDAIMKVWEFKTSGFTEIRTLDAASGKPINMLEKPQ